MTGQKPYGSHVPHLLETTAALVNAVTPGLAHGRQYAAPEDRALRAAVAAALGVRAVTTSQATSLVDLARRARRVFVAVETGDPDRAARLTNALLRETEARPQLDRRAGGGWTLHFHGPDVTLVRGWGAGVAAGLAMALGSDLAGRLGVCAADACDRVYVDLSRNGGKRFCSTRCQSRVKAAAFRVRSRA